MPAVAVLLLSALIGVPPSAHPSAMEGGRLLSFDEFHKKIVEERALREGKVDVTDAIRKDRRNERHLLPFAMDAARIACEHVLNARKADIDAHGNETLYYPDVVACDREFAGDGGVFEAEVQSLQLDPAKAHDLNVDALCTEVEKDLAKAHPNNMVNAIAMELSIGSYCAKAYQPPGAAPDATIDPECKERGWPVGDWFYKRLKDWIKKSLPKTYVMQTPKHGLGGKEIPPWRSKNEL